MTTIFTEDVDKNLRSAVDDFGLVGEIVCPGNKAQYLYAPFHAVEVAQICLQCGKSIDRTGACGLLGLLQGYVDTHTSGKMNALVNASLAGNKQQISRLIHGLIKPGGTQRFGQFNIVCFQILVNVHQCFPFFLDSVQFRQLATFFSCFAPMHESYVSLTEDFLHFLAKFGRF